MEMETIFSLWYHIGFGVILNGLRCAIEAGFLARFLRVRLKPLLFILYIAACYLISFSLGAYRIPLWIHFCAHFTLMFALGVALLGGFSAAALAPCMITATQFALADGLSASVLSVLMFVVIRARMAWIGFVVPLAIPIALLVPSYYFLKYLSEKYRKINADASYLHLLLLPCLLIVIVMHFNWNLWEMTTTTLGPGAAVDYARAGRETILLLCAFLAFGAVLAAFFKMMESAARDAEKSNLEQQIKTQRQYVAEARQRNEQYRAFHHDIANHFSVLSGLISAENNAEAAEYLRKIKDNADMVVGVISSGNMVLDVLLGEKIAYARRQGVTVTWDIQLDRCLGIDDFDLCVLFANAMDNAILACENDAGETKDIHITSKIKNNFLFIELENTCIPDTQIVWGVGLKNMKRTAEKYHGTINAAVDGNRFRLSILLCLPADRMGDSLHDGKHLQGGLSPTVALSLKRKKPLAFTRRASCPSNARQR